MISQKISEVYVRLLDPTRKNYKKVLEMYNALEKQNLKNIYFIF